MNDAIVLRTHGEMAYAKLPAIALKCFHLLAANRIVDVFLLVAGGIMVWHRIDLFRSKNFQSFVAKRIECLRAGNFVDIQPIDV